MEHPELNINQHGYYLSRPIPSITYRLGHYTLRFEGIEGGGDARFSISKYEKKVDTVLAQAGSTVSLNFENGDKGVEFKLVDAIDDGKVGIVQLEDIISSSSESTSANPGEIGFSGMPSVTIESGGRRTTLNPDLELGAGESQDFEAVLKVPDKPGVQKLTINLELDDIWKQSSSRSRSCSKAHDQSRT
jgi:hypothetical protein